MQLGTNSTTKYQQTFVAWLFWTLESIDISFAVLSKGPKNFHFPFLHESNECDTSFATIYSDTFFRQCTMRIIFLFSSTVVSSVFVEYQISWISMLSWSMKLMFIEVQFLITYCIAMTSNQEFTYPSNCDLNYPKSIKIDAHKS